MRLTHLAAAVLVASAGASLFAAQQKPTAHEHETMKPLAEATADIAGDGITGTATLAEYQHGGSRLVQIHLTVSGLKPGQHGVHLHAVGKCEAPFESAGPHFNPGNHKHGILSGEGHAGDMPNLHVPQSGELSVEVVNSAISLERGKPNSVFDNDGSSLVVHAKADDYKTDPAGNAGDRIACGVIQQSGAATVGSSPPPKQ